MWVMLRRATRVREAKAQILMGVLPPLGLQASSAESIG